MEKIMFLILWVLGMGLICELAFLIPTNPYEIIPSYSVMGFDKPLWFCIIFVGGFLYSMLLYYLYDRFV